MGRRMNSAVMPVSAVGLCSFTTGPSGSAGKRVVGPVGDRSARWFDRPDAEPLAQLMDAFDDHLGPFGQGRVHQHAVGVALDDAYRHARGYPPAHGPDEGAVGA